MHSRTSISDRRCEPPFRGRAYPSWWERCFFFGDRFGGGDGDGERERFLESRDLALLTRSGTDIVVEVGSNM
jgi:hypothetical protein